jgi:RNA polymerase sigma factor (TIGR02999 family)
VSGSPEDITRLLHEWRDGNQDAFERLMPLAYPHLRKVAASFMRHERGEHIQATELVHELYLRLIQQRNADWKDRGHFYTFAAKLMRMILIDQARRTQADKRGGSADRVPLSEELAWIDAGSPDLLMLDRALDELEKLDAHKVRLVELRFFLGCTSEEAAEALGVSKATVDRELKLIKGWLYRRIRGSETRDPAGSDSG